MPEPAPSETSRATRLTDRAATIEQMKTMVDEGRKPWLPPPKSAGATPESDSEVYTADDLFAEDGELNMGRVFRMPGGKKVWVYGCNTEDMALIRRGLRRGRAAGAPAPDVEEAILDAMAWQAIACCRTGERRGSSDPVFTSKHFDHLRQRLGFAVLRRICAVSEELSGGGEAVTPGISAFFSRMSRACGTLLSMCDSFAGCLSGWMECQAPGDTSSPPATFPESGVSGTSVPSETALALAARSEELRAALEAERVRAHALLRIVAGVIQTKELTDDDVVAMLGAEA